MDIVFKMKQVRHWIILSAITVCILSKAEATTYAVTASTETVTDLQDAMIDDNGTSTQYMYDDNDESILDTANITQAPAPNHPDEVDTEGLTTQQCIQKLYFLFVHMLDDLGMEPLYCKCMGLYCPNQTEEEIQDIFLEIKKANDRKTSGDDIGIALSYTIVMFVGTVGNILVLVTVFKVFKAPSVTNMFISSLSIADLLVIVLCIPFRIIDYVGAQVWTLGEEACKFFYYMYFASFMCSVFTLTAMSMERYLVICHPMKAASMSTTGRARKIIVAAWILAFALAVPTLLMAGVRSFECDVFTAKNHEWLGPFYLYIFCVVFLLPSLIMGYAYTRTSLALFASIQMSNRMTSGNESSAKNSSDSKARLQVIKMLALVWAFFTVTWGAYLSFHVLNAYRVEVNLPTTGFTLTTTSQVLNILTMANSAVNPILYAFMSGQFRRGFLKCLGCIPIIKRKYLQPTTTSNATASSGVYSQTAASASNGVNTVSMTVMKDNNAKS